jgi:nucleoside-diphosphate-sugar epimerase
VRYVVTGAAGFIGSHLAETLRADGHELVCVDSFSDYYDSRLKEENAASLDIVRADLTKAPLEELFAGAGGIFHLAGQPGVRASWGADFELYLSRNVLASQRVFEAACALGIRVMFASSSSIYGDAETYPTPENARPLPISPYGITKLMCEHLARAYARGAGLDCVSLRYFTVYGPRQRPDMAFTRMLFALARSETFELYGDGRQSRGFTFVSDAIAATVAAMGAPAGAVYNVGGGSESTMLEAIALAESLSGRTLDVRFRPAAPGDVRRTAADISRIRAALEWAPRTPLEDGLTAQWEWAWARVEGR